MRIHLPKIHSPSVLRKVSRCGEPVRKLLNREIANRKTMKSEFQLNSFFSLEFECFCRHFEAASWQFCRAYPSVLSAIQSTPGEILAAISLNLETHTCNAQAVHKVTLLNFLN